MEVDPGEAVDESEELDNEYTKTITITPGGIIASYFIPIVLSVAGL